VAKSNEKNFSLTQEEKNQQEKTRRQNSNEDK
jgi:hypothetical protein